MLYHCDELYCKINTIIEVLPNCFQIIGNDIDWVLMYE